MRNLNLVVGLCLCLVGVAWGAAALAQEALQERPRIRAVTAFIDVDKDSYAARMDEASRFLTAAKTAFNGAGFGGAGGRVTTQPFPQ